MKQIIRLSFILFCYASSFSPIVTQAATNACDCGSTDINSPCESQSITTDIIASRNISFEWQFNSSGGNAYCGQFANGDYWLAPKNGASVEVTSLLSQGSGPISLDENPQLESLGLLSESNPYANYLASENLLPRLPVQFNYSTSLVAAVQRDEALHGGCGTKAILGNCAEAYHIVTILDKVPEKAGSEILRPSIDESTKELISLSDLDFSRFPEKTYFKGGTQENIESIRQRWSHSLEIFSGGTIDGPIFSEGGRAYRANLLVDDYASGVAAQWYNDLTNLFSTDWPLSEKMPAIAAMLVYGKDLYYAHYSAAGIRERNWKTGAGQFTGRFMPAVFFSAMAKDTSFGNVLKKTSTTLGLSGGPAPLELEQVNKGVNTPVWGDSLDVVPDIRINAYWSDMFGAQCYDGATGTCKTNIGKKTARDPYGYIDGPATKPGSSYMAVTFGPIKSMAATMMLMPQACEIVNYDELVTYVNRIENHGIYTANDQCAPPDPREVIGECNAYNEIGCQYYKVTWGPDPAKPGQCIKNKPGQNGRFPALDGSPLDYVYKSGQIESNWSEITGGLPGCRPIPVTELTSLIASDVNKGNAPLTVKFNGSFSGTPDGDITQWNWDFGNGDTQSGALTSYVFNEPGSYTVSLAVTDSFGNSTNSTKVINVTQAARPGLVFGLGLDNNLIDSSDNNVSSSWVGTAAYSQGLMNQAASFSPAANNSITAEHHENLDGMDNISISYWAKKNNANIGERILTKHVTYSSSVLSNGVFFYVFTSAGQLNITATSESVRDTAWHHYVLTYDGTNAKVYIDGQVKASKAWTGAVVTQPTRGLIIGRYPNGSIFNGHMDELYIYNKSLSSLEIASLQTPEVRRFREKKPVLSISLSNQSTNNIIISKDTVKTDPDIKTTKSYTENQLLSSQEVATLKTIIPVDTTQAAVKFENDKSIYSVKDSLLPLQKSVTHSRNVLEQPILFNPEASNYITTKQHLIQDEGNQLSISYWVRKGDTNSPNISLTKTNSYALNVLTNGVYFSLFTSTGRLDISATDKSLRDTAWHHYVLTYDGTKARIYIDGKEEASKKWHGKIMNQPIPDLFVNENSRDKPFNNNINKPYVYNRALSLEEINVLQISLSPANK